MSIAMQASSFSMAWIVLGLPYLLMQEMDVQYFGQEHPLEKEITTHSSISAWEIS